MLEYCALTKELLPSFQPDLNALVSQRNQKQEQHYKKEKTVGGEDDDADPTIMPLIDVAVLCIGAIFGVRQFLSWGQWAAWCRWCGGDVTGSGYWGACG